MLSDAHSLESHEDKYRGLVSPDILYLTSAAIARDSVVRFFTGDEPPILTQEQFEWLAENPVFFVPRNDFPTAYRYYLHRMSLRAGEEGIIIPELEFSVDAERRGIVNRALDWIGRRVVPDHVFDICSPLSLDPVKVENP